MNLDNEEFWGLARLGYVLQEEGRVAEARAVFEGLTVVNPSEAYPWRALGCIARDDGKLSQAVDLFAHSLKLAESDTTRLQLGEVLILSGRLADAMPVLRPASQGDSVLARRARALLARCQRS